MHYFFEGVDQARLHTLFSAPPFLFVPGDRVWLSGDLGSGKTTFVQTFLRDKIPDTVRSPTYTYYSRYVLPGNIPLYHFDLYRIEDESTFPLIGGEEILDDPVNICLIEWPERIASRFQPTHAISFRKRNEPELRDITVETF